MAMAQAACFHGEACLVALEGQSADNAFALSSTHHCRTLTWKHDKLSFEQTTIKFMVQYTLSIAWNLNIAVVLAGISHLLMNSSRMF